MPSKPGFFDASFSKNDSPQGPSDWTTVATLPDFPGYEMVRQTNFTLGFRVPSNACSHCILRMRYVSYNKLEIDPANNTDAIFYNCADVELVSSGEHSQQISPAIESPVDVEQSPKSVVAPYTCTTPPVWSLICAESTSLGIVTHRIWWDSVRKFTRWDLEGNLWNEKMDTVILINNYTDPPVEYVNFITSLKKCHQYGNDEFYPWSYGPGNGQTYAGRVGSIDSWTRAGGFTWSTEDLGGGLCKPFGWTRGNGYSAVCADFGTGPISPDVFKPDPACLHHPLFGGCRAKQLKDLWNLSHK